MMKDAQDHALSGATAEAVQHYDAAVTAYNQAYGDAIGGFNAAIAAAPKFVMPRLAKGWLLSQSRDPMIVPRAQAELQVAATLPMNERELGHAAALTQGGRGCALYRRGAARPAFDALPFRHPGPPDRPAIGPGTGTFPLDA